MTNAKVHQGSAMTKTLNSTGVITFMLENFL